MMWKIQQAMQDDAIQVAIIHQGNRAEMFISENFQPAYRDAGWKNRDLGSRASPPCHTNTSKISQPGSCEEALSKGVAEKNKFSN